MSVVLPTFNRGHVLARAIRSVLDQTCAGLELIVVDDGSDDGTQACVAGFDDPRVRYMRNGGRRGAAAARNTGIAAARGSWIAFQDSDDEWLPHKLERQLEAARAAPDPDTVIYCGALTWRGGRALYTPLRNIRLRNGDILDQLLRSNTVGTQTLLVRKACLLRVGGFDEQLRRFQDWELAIRLAAHYPFRLVDEPLVNVFHSAESISEDSAAQVHALARIFDKHAALFDRIADSRFSLMAGLGLANLSYGKLGLARRHLGGAWAIRPRSVTGWRRFVFSYLLPHIYGRLGSRRAPRP